MKSMSPQVWLLTYNPEDQTPPEGHGRFASDSDHKRYVSFRHKGARTQFAMARLLAAAVLEQSFGREAARWVIGYEDRGQPRLENCPRNSPNISISHTSGMVAFAVSPEGLIGVDVEDHRRKADIQLLAREVFSPAESMRFQDIAFPAARRNFFFKCWTLKEAYTKALGLGLYAAFRSIEMEITSADVVSLINPAPDDRNSARKWHLYHNIYLNSFHVAIAHMNASYHPGRLAWHMRPTSLEVAEHRFNVLHLTLPLPKE